MSRIAYPVRNEPCARACPVWVYIDEHDLSLCGRIQGTRNAKFHTSVFSSRRFPALIGQSLQYAAAILHNGSAIVTPRHNLVVDAVQNHVKTALSVSATGETNAIAVHFCHVQTPSRLALFSIHLATRQDIDLPVFSDMRSSACRCCSVNRSSNLIRCFCSMSGPYRKISPDGSLQSCPDRCRVQPYTANTRTGERRWIKCSMW